MRPVGMAKIGDLCGDNLCCRGAGAINELIDLMRTDIAEDAAELLVVPEPVGPAAAAASQAPLLEDLMGREIDGLNDFADSPLADQLACIDRRANFQPFGVHDPVNAPGFRNGF